MTWPSREKAGFPSLDVVLTVGPRFTGDPHGSSTLARCETYMSKPPSPPGRLEAKYRLRPSFEIAGCWSLDAELMTGPRLTGADQSEYFWAWTDGTLVMTRESMPPITNARTKCGVKLKRFLLFSNEIVCFMVIVLSMEQVWVSRWSSGRTRPSRVKAR